MMKPATELPWSQGNGGHNANIIYGGVEREEPDYDAPSVCLVYGIGQNQTMEAARRFATAYPTLYTGLQDAAYIAHACNLYPELVEALMNALELMSPSGTGGTDSPWEQSVRAILAKCGEE